MDTKVMFNVDQIRDPCVRFGSESSHHDSWANWCI